MRSIFIASLGFVLFATGCGRDYKKIADRMVSERLLGQFEQREAVPFFEEKGKFFDVDETTTVDQDVVLPLLKRLREVAPTEQWALLTPEKTDSALAVLIKLPPQMPVVDQMAEEVQKADDTFSGLIVQQWGHQWLQIALLDEKSVEYLKKTRPNLEKQR